jgi:hypothetical protein
LETNVNGAFIVGTKKHGYRVTFHTRAIDGTVDSTLKDIIRPSGQTIGDVYDKSSLLLVVILILELQE